MTENATDRELLRLLIKEAVRDGMDEHVKHVHSPLDERIDATRRQVWTGTGLVIAAGAFFKWLVPR